MHNLIDTTKIDYYDVDGKPNYVIVYWRFDVEYGYSVELNLNDSNSVEVYVNVEGQYDYVLDDLSTQIYDYYINLINSDKSKIHELMMLDELDQVKKYMVQNPIVTNN
jgi:hypothetical protein